MPRDLDSIDRELAALAHRFGTPLYGYDRRTLVAQYQRLSGTLPDGVQVFYSLKANASLGISEVFAQCDLGADVAGPGELMTAIEAGFTPDRIYVAGPYKPPETIAWLAENPAAMVSLDSPGELERLARAGLENRAVLRLRPDFESRACVNAGRGSRFGFTPQDLQDCRSLLRRVPLVVQGFHIFAGSQILHADDVIAHLEAASDQAQRAAMESGIELSFVNLGGGFGIPYAADDPELDLPAVAAALHRLQASMPETRLALELGRYLVANSGWYITRVVERQTHQGRPAVVVDGGTHQRADMCGLNLRKRAVPPRVLKATDAPRRPTDVLGCLSLPADILSEACLLPPLKAGDLLAYPTAGAYGHWSSAAHFHGYALPAEVLFDEQDVIVMRAPPAARDVLVGQHSTRQDCGEKISG